MVLNKSTVNDIQKIATKQFLKYYKKLKTFLLNYLRSYPRKNLTDYMSGKGFLTLYVRHPFVGE